MRKFTLIELLIVIAIIGMLVSLLLPSLSEARNKTKDAVCMSNLRQVGIGMTTFTLDNDGNLPAHKINNSTSWMELIDVDVTDAYLCPRVTKWVYNNGNEFKPNISTSWFRVHRGAYGYNAFWLGLSSYAAGFQSQPMARNYTKVIDCYNPSEVIMAADSSPMDGGAWSSTLWYKWRKRTVGVNNEGVKAVHGSKQENSNIVFIDGHVRPYKAYDINYNDSLYKDWWNPNPSVYTIGF